MEWTRHGPAQEGLTTKHFSRLICLFYKYSLGACCRQTVSGSWGAGSRAVPFGLGRKVGSSVAGGGEVCG